MKQQTLHDRFVAKLVARGCVLTKAVRTSRYTVLARPDGKFYFVGRSGGLRVGRTVSGSIGLSDRAKAKILNEGN